MAETPLTGIPYPGRYEDPWYDSFVSGMNSIDAQLGALREDRSIFIWCLGVVSFSGSTLTWQAPITIYNAKTGQETTIAAGSLTIASGQVAYVTVSRPMTTLAASFTVAATTPSNDIVIPLVVRRDVSGVGLVYLRGGGVLWSGMYGAPWANLADKGSLTPFLVETASALVSGDLVEPNASGNLIAVQSSSTACIGVCLFTVTGNGTLRNLVQSVGYVELIVKTGESVVAGTGVKPSSTVNQIMSTGANTFQGRIGIALQSMTGDGATRCKVMLSIHGN